MAQPNVNPEVTAALEAKGFHAVAHPPSNQIVYLRTNGRGRLEILVKASGGSPTRMEDPVELRFNSNDIPEVKVAGTYGSLTDFLAADA
jgi:hypothetical protein